MDQKKLNQLFFVNLVVLSLFLHGLFFWGITIPKNSSNSSAFQRAKLAQAPVKILLNSDKMAKVKLRTLGIDNGKKDAIYLNHSPDSVAKKIAENRPFSKVTAHEQKFSSFNRRPELQGKDWKQQSAPNLADLNPETSSATKKASPSQEELSPHSKGPKRPKAIQKLAMKGKSLSDFMRSEGIGFRTDSQSRSPLLSNSDLDVQLEIPEGVNLDQLNQVEMMFYSFHKRNFVSYINSLLSTIEKHSLKNPHLRFLNINGKESVTGRITFDKEGNIKAIKMVKWSSDDRFQQFFLDVLQGIHSLPNPPKALLDKDNQELSVYYTLTVDNS